MTGCNVQEQDTRVEGLLSSKLFRFYPKISMVDWALHNWLFSPRTQYLGWRASQIQTIHILPEEIHGQLGAAQLLVMSKNIIKELRGFSAPKHSYMYFSSSHSEPWWNWEGLDRRFSSIHTCISSRRVILNHGKPAQFIHVFLQDKSHLQPW